MFNDSNRQTQYCERCLKWAEKYEKLEQENERLKEENKRLQMLSCVNCGEKYLAPDGSELYEENVQLKAENEKLLHTLQEIKEIAEQILNKNEFVYMNYRDVRQIIRLVTKAEEE